MPCFPNAWYSALHEHTSRSHCLTAWATGLVIHITLSFSCSGSFWEQLGQSGQFILMSDELHTDQTTIPGIMLLLVSQLSGFADFKWKPI